MKGYPANMMNYKGFLIMRSPKYWKIYYCQTFIKRYKSLTNCKAYITGVRDALELEANVMYE